jgi:hypothetical protein
VSFMGVNVAVRARRVADAATYAGKSAPTRRSAASQIAPTRHFLLPQKTRTDRSAR